MSSHHGTVAGAVGGTLLSIFASIHSGDVTKTIILATVGAVVSFLVSLGLK
jgi:mannitol-specific phosphotransferase system IIBC component